MEGLTSIFFLCTSEKKISENCWFFTSNSTHLFAFWYIYCFQIYLINLSYNYFPLFRQFIKYWIMLNSDNLKIAILDFSFPPNEHLSGYHSVNTKGKAISFPHIPCFIGLSPSSNGLIKRTSASPRHHVWVTPK
jgi:hypothetical protein